MINALKRREKMRRRGRGLIFKAPGLSVAAINWVIDDASGGTGEADGSLVSGGFTDAHSSQTITGGFGYVECTVNAAGVFGYIGLAQAPFTDDNIGDTSQFALRFNGSGAVEAHADGSYQSETPVVANDVIRIEITGASEVQYKKNGTTFYTHSALAVSYPISVDGYIQTDGDRIDACKIRF